MKTEENKRMLALSCIVADLKAENMELVERLQQLENDYADVLNQFPEEEQRNDEDQSNPTIDDMQQMREQYNELERMNKKLDRFAKVMHEFVMDKNIYMRKGTSCEYKQGNPPVYSPACMGCSSCLSVIKEQGVVCKRRLKEANVYLPDND